MKHNRYPLNAQGELLTWRDNPRETTLLMTAVKSFHAGRSALLVLRNDASLLLKTPIRVTEIQNRVLASRAAAKFLDTEGFDFPQADLQLALEMDRFQFAMKVERIDKLSVLRPVDQS